MFYYNKEQVKEVIKKLAREPYYQHAGEDFYAGICAVDGELMMLPTVEYTEVPTTRRGLHLGNKYYCANCGQLAYLEKYCSQCGAKIAGEDTV